MNGNGIDFRVELLRNNPLYVRDALVMANYEQKEYLIKIVSDALADFAESKEYEKDCNGTKEKYRIAQADYEAFREKYSINK